METGGHACINQTECEKFGRVKITASVKCTRTEVFLVKMDTSYEQENSTL